MIIDTISGKNIEVDCQEIEAEANADKRSFVLIRVGSNEHPATDTDIEDMKKNISDLDLEKGVQFLITHHCIDIQVIYV